MLGTKRDYNEVIRMGAEATLNRRIYMGLFGKKKTEKQEQLDCE